MTALVLVKEPSLAQFDNEQADAILMVYASHCDERVHHNVLMRKVDTDVVVFAISKFYNRLLINYGLPLEPRRITG